MAVDSVADAGKLKSTSAFLTLPLVAILLAHYLIDVFSAVVPASLNLIQTRWSLSDVQAAWLVGLGSLTSGLSQPLFAWISDRTDNRIYGGLGLVLAGGFIGSMQWAEGPWVLFVFYAIGMMGNGMFHPVAASTVGALDPVNRARKVTVFFIAGMAGGVTGSWIAPRLLVLDNGFQLMNLLLVPAMVMAFFLHWQIRHLPHRSPAAVTGKVAIETTRSRWRGGHASLAIVLLYIAAAVRFTVNVGLVYLYAQWMKLLVREEQPGLSPEAVSDIAGPLTGNLNAATMVGMAMGGLAAGFLIRGGKEKWPLVLVPLLLAPAIALLPFSGPTTRYVLAMLAGAGFASMVPVTLGVAQRLLPARTSFASGLMLGGAWSVALFGPAIAHAVHQSLGLDAAFYVLSGMLALSGAVLLPVDSAMIEESAGR